MCSLVSLVCILQEDVFLRELATAEAEVSIEIPVFTIAHACADTCIADCCTTLQRSGLCIVVSSVCHETCADSKLNLLLLIVDIQSRGVVKVLCCSRKSHNSQSRHENIFFISHFSFNLIF